MRRSNITMLKRCIFLIAFISISQLFSQSFVLVDSKEEFSGFECITVSLDHQYLLSGQTNGQLLLWDLNKKLVLKRVEAHQKQINSIFFNPKGDQIVTAGNDGQIVIYSYPSLEIIKTILVPHTVFNFAVFSADGKWVYFGGNGEITRNWLGELRYSTPFSVLYRSSLANDSKKPEIVVKDETGNTALPTITDGNAMAADNDIVFCRGNKLMVFNHTQQQIKSTTTLPVTLNALLPCDSVIYVWGDKWLMKVEKLMDNYVVTNRVMAGTNSAFSGYSRILLSQHHKFLVTGDDSNFVNIWTPMELKHLQKLKGHTGAVRTFVFYNNDSILITAGYDKRIKFWHYNPNQPLNEDKTVVENNNTVINDTTGNYHIGTHTYEKVTVNEPNVKIRIWNSTVAPKARISLKLNGQIILENYTLSNRKWELSAAINPANKTNYLTMIIKDADKFPQVQASISIEVNGKELEFNVTSTSEKPGGLDIVYSSR
jgi:WD40 repeat protein